MNRYQHVLSQLKEFENKINLSILVYLVDWKSCIEYGCQATEVNWKNGITPIIWDLDNKIISTEDQLIEAVLFVKETASKMEAHELVRLCQSTYPVYFQEKNKNLNLVNLSREYNNIKHLF